jgi:hypothetical protein
VGIVGPILVEIDTQNISAQRALVSLTFTSHHGYIHHALQISSLVTHASSDTLDGR